MNINNKIKVYKIGRHSSAIISLDGVELASLDSSEPHHTSYVPVLHLPTKQVTKHYKYHYKENK